MRDDIRNSLNKYAIEGCPTGDFLAAVLSNDLMAAMGRADEENRHDLFEICSYVYNDLPASCHGSREKVRDWLRMHLERRTAEVVRAS